MTNKKCSTRTRKTPLRLDRAFALDGWKIPLDHVVQVSGNDALEILRRGITRNFVPAAFYAALQIS